MAIIITELERKAEKAAHPNENKYKIFSIDPESKEQVVVEIFWTKDDVAAYNHLLEVRKNLARDDVYFDSFYHFITINDDGTETVYDSMQAMHSKMYKSVEDDDDDESPYEQTKREKDAMMKDIKFFIDHYDHENCSSHMRNESWSLDTHMLDDLEFNIPIIKEEANGVPQNFVDKACEMLHNSYEELSKDKESDDRMFKLAKQLWHEELDNMLHHIWLYNYYSDFGIIDDKAPDEKKDFLKNYKIPMKAGRLDAVDYEKVSDMLEVEWKAIWEWMIKHGRSLWT